MKTFVIQSKLTPCGHLVPMQSYGYTAIEAVEYANWINGEQVYGYELHLCNDDNWSLSRTFRSSCEDDPAEDSDDYNYLRGKYVPIGSVEFVSEWLRQMDADIPKPLNIPEELWSFVKRKVMLDKPINHTGTSFSMYVKSVDEIKSKVNGEYLLDGAFQGDTVYFMTEMVEPVVSEWRVFVYDRQILGIRCYSGDEWVLPKRDYIEDIVKVYDKRCYTLDVMVYEKQSNEPWVNICKGVNHVTDIVELHDFFACGLYGFEDLKNLPKMWMASIQDILGRR